MISNYGKQHFPYLVSVLMLILLLAAPAWADEPPPPVEGGGEGNKAGIVEDDKNKPPLESSKGQSAVMSAGTALSSSMQNVANDVMNSGARAGLSQAMTNAMLARQQFNKDVKSGEYNRSTEFIARMIQATTIIAPTFQKEKRSKIDSPDPIPAPALITPPLTLPPVAAPNLRISNTAVNINIQEGNQGDGPSPPPAPQPSAANFAVDRQGEPFLVQWVGSRTNPSQLVYDENAPKGPRVNPDRKVAAKNPKLEAQVNNNASQAATLQLIGELGALVSELDRQAIESAKALAAQGSGPAKKAPVNGPSTRSLTLFADESSPVAPVLGSSTGAARSPIPGFGDGTVGKKSSDKITPRALRNLASSIFQPHAWKNLWDSVSEERQPMLWLLLFTLLSLLGLRFTTRQAK